MADETTPKPETTPPPAAQTVINGDRTEKTVELAAELEKERAARKKAETESAGWQDKYQTLITAQKSAPAPAPAPAKARGFRLPRVLINCGDETD